MAKLEDLREWLLDRIDGGEEMRGEDGLVSDFIRQIDAATAELADLKQRLLPQYIGRAERAQRERQMISHERDSLLEKLRAATSMPCAPSATAATQDAQAIVASCCAAFDCRPSELLGMILGLKGTAPPVEEEAIGHARYEYLRTLNPRKFAALYNEALADERFDDLVDRYRMKKEQSNQQGILDGSHHDASQPSPTTREQPK